MQDPDLPELTGISLMPGFDSDDFSSPSVEREAY